MSSAAEEEEVSLEALRARLDVVDGRLLALLRERQDAARAIGRIKAERGIPIVQPAREQEVYQARKALGAELGLSPTFVQAVWEAIHDESCRQQALAAEAMTLEAMGRAPTAPDPGVIPHIPSTRGERDR